MIRIVIITTLLLGSVAVLIAQPADRLLTVVTQQRNQLLDLVAQLETKLLIANEEIITLKRENEILKGGNRGPGH